MGFVATSGGGYWLTNPADEVGFNFGAGLLFLGGVLIGTVGLLLALVSVFVRERAIS